jgi:hypothetical protein
MGVFMAIRLFVLILTLSFGTQAFAYIVDGSRVNQPRLLSFAKTQLQNYGTLHQGSDGATYLKVADKYIRDLIKQIRRPGFKAPKSGAHIAVIQQEEAKGIMSLKEIGQKVPFKPLGFYTIVNDDKEYFMLAIDSPELCNLRKSYGLTAQLENHAFSLVIGVRQLEAHNQLAGPQG